MATNTYKAQLNYHDSRWGWGNEGTASQGAWDGTGTRTGVLYFPGLASLKNKIINSVKITVTTGQTGWGLATTKTVNFYRSAAQGGIKTSLNANHKTGSAIGSVQGAMYNNTVTYTAAFLAARIAAGDDTYCIYNGSSSTDYLKWTSVSLEVNWSEPATQPSLSKSTVEMGTAVTISTPAANSGYRHTLRYAFGNASGMIASGVASAQSWTPPVSLAAQIPSATSGSGAIYCDTYSGSTLLGTKSVSITLTVPASVRPTAGTLSAAVADDSSGTGMYVKGMGKARVTLSGAAGAQGSSIRSTVISGGGWSASGTTLLTGVLTAAGTVTFTATVTDSRGRTASTTTSISVIDYARPGISSCTVYRCNSAGARQNDGTYAAVEIKAFYSAISGNTLSLGVAYKRSSESGYGGSTTLTNNGKTIIGGGLSASTTYDVRVTVSDKYNTVEQVYSLPTKSVLLSFLKNLGAAIGKVAELSGWLDIGLNTRIRENLQVDGTVQGIEALIPRGKTNAAAFPVVFVPQISYSQIEPNHQTNEYLKNWLKWVCTNYPNQSNTTFIGSCRPNSQGIVMCFIYETSVINSEGLPQYACGQYTGLGAHIHIFGTNEYSFYFASSDLGFIPVQQGGGANQRNHKVYIGWTGYSLDVQVDNVNLGSILTSGKAISEVLPVSRGGTGALNAADARTNLGFYKVRLYQGSLSAGSATLEYGANYRALIIVGRPSSAADRVAQTISAEAWTTAPMQLCDNEHWIRYNVTASGSHLIVNILANNEGGMIEYVFGIL